MSGRRVTVVFAVAIATLAGASTAPAAQPGQPLGAHVSGCARAALGQRADPPAVTCAHEGHSHSFATFGELVAHLRLQHE